MSERLYGIVAEFNEPEEILVAAHAAREAGYKRMDAYTPYPVHHLDEALGMSNTRMGWVVLLMGIFGGSLMFFMQWFATTQHYPLNVGGRPLFSWPQYIVITFEGTVLFAAFTAAFFMLARNGLPRLHHPIFNTPNFEHATRDKFFLCIEADDAEFDVAKTRAFLEGLTPKPLRVSEVEL